LALLGLAVIWLIVIVPVLHVAVAPWLAVAAVLWLSIVTIVASSDRAAIVPFGLLSLAMLLPQHGGPLGGVGALSVGAALVSRELSARGLVSAPVGARDTVAVDA
jgi:hypothetical protein